MKRQVFSLLMALGIESSKAADWNYLEHGADWEDSCTTETNQSPINLLTRENVGFEYPLIKPNKGDEEVSYYNQEGNIVNWNGFTS